MKNELTPLFPQQLITRGDLQEFRMTLLSELKEMISNNQPPKWIKSGEVKQILKISSGTLQTLRINGTLSYTKIGGIYFYNYDDIQKKLNL